MGKDRAYRMCEWLCLLVVLVMSLFVIEENSPLFQNVNMDSAIFLSIGQGITEGRTPYVDITENKGPLFFLMMALPQFVLSGTTGVYMLETLFLLGGCWLIMRMVRWMTPEKRHPLLFLLPVMWFVYRYSGNNFCEEYDLFFTLAGAAVMVHALTGQERGAQWRAFWLGLSAMSVLLIKMSDLIPLAATVVCYIIYVIRHKKDFWREALRFCAGMAAVAVPVCIYLLCAGAFGAMIREYFLNNLVHILLGKGAGFWAMRWRLISGGYGLDSIRPVMMLAAAMLLVRWIQPSDERKAPAERFLRWYLAALAGANLLVGYVASSGFSQHLMLGQVTEVMAIVLLLRALWQRMSRMEWAQKLMKGRCLISLAAGAAFLTFWALNLTPHPYVWEDGYQDMVAYEQEFSVDLEDCEDSLFTIGITPCWYWYNGYYPVYPYYNIKGFIVDNVGADQAQAFEDYLLENPISAILIRGGIEDYRGILTDGTIDFLHENYYIYSECSLGERTLLKLF